MFVVGNFVGALAELVDFLLWAYTLIVIGRVVISWVNADPYNPIVRFIYEATEPLLGRLRRYIPLTFGGIDFSPVLLIMAITFLQSFLVETMRQLARNMG